MLSYTCQVFTFANHKYFQFKYVGTSQSSFLYNIVSEFWSDTLLYVYMNRLWWCFWSTLLALLSSCHPRCGVDWMNNKSVHIEVIYLPSIKNWLPSQISIEGLEEILHVRWMILRTSPFSSSIYNRLGVIWLKNNTDYWSLIAWLDKRNALCLCYLPLSLLPLSLLLPISMSMYIMATNRDSLVHWLISLF